MKKLCNLSYGLLIARLVNHFGADTTEVAGVGSIFSGTLFFGGKYYWVGVRGASGLLKLFALKDVK